MNVKERVKFAFGVFVALFGFLLVGGSLSGDSGNNWVADLITAFLFGVVPSALGIWLCIRTVKGSRARRKDELENQILQLAVRYKGRMTASEAAMHTSLSVAEAAKLLEEYAKTGVVRLKIASGGVMVYEFVDILSEEEKMDAKGLGDLL